MMMYHNNTHSSKYCHSFYVIFSRRNNNYWTILLIIVQCWCLISNICECVTAFQSISDYGCWSSRRRIHLSDSNLFKLRQQLCGTNSFENKRTSFWGLSSHASITSTRNARNCNCKLYQQSSSSSSQQQDQSVAVTASAGTTLPPVILIDKVTCSYDGGKSYQLQDTSYIVQRTSKVALVGRNGAGKSTLLRIIAQAVGAIQSSSSGSSSNFNDDSYFDIAYTGSVTCARDVRISFVEQEPPMPSDITVADALLGITTTTTTTTTSTTTSSGRQKQPKSVFDAVRMYRIASQNAEADRK
jgi:ATPase subunit of ABC transporter with duplicated ATPase domains